MQDSKKVVITAALTGVLATRDQCPYIPYTPEEIAEEGRRALEAGASILHIHARQDNGAPAFDVETYRRIYHAVRDRCGDVIINFSTGAVGIPREERIHHITALKPDMAALNMGSMNYAIYSPKNKQFYHDFVFQNPFKDIQYFLEKMVEAGTLPEMEAFDCGHIHNAMPFIDMGILKPPYVFSFVMGVMGGIPATTENLLHQARSVPPGSHWQVIGIGRKQWSLVAAALTIGGHIRVGLEDNFYLPEGDMAKSNGELVEAAVRLAKALGREPATVAETRAMLNMPFRG
ncbi:MAG: 3-keto-5-aminohexanoate cleavage protein [Bacteroidia bacterium]|nr:3-keto-5-aminohexanoate cleavage protein [Bacteroidia bacterium]MCX7651552.1 3-keto-5-aminohexanoate cleavage protein [Bacteroidia bacterium]MDW8416252.1 3-keto-5-aminohexanoate cleavage protein [Bacteroidia bacterium]